jgi:hypothetical protein
MPVENMKVKEVICTPILLVWEMVPEDTQFFLLKDLDEETFKKVYEAHGKFVNDAGACNEDKAAVEWLSNYLIDQDQLDMKEPEMVSGSVCIVMSGCFL